MGGKGRYCSVGISKLRAILFGRLHYIITEHAAGFLVDQTGDPLDTAPPGQAPDGGLGDPLDVVTENLAVPLDSTLAQSEMWPQTLQNLRRTSIAVREAPSAYGPECLRIQDLRV